jgi:hypothetical protein
MWSTHDCIGWGSASYAFSESDRKIRRRTSLATRAGPQADGESRVIPEALTDVERVPKLVGRAFQLPALGADG